MLITPEKNLLFDHDNIQKIYAIGYTDDEQKNFMRVLDKDMDLRDERLNKNIDIIDDDIEQ